MNSPAELCEDAISTRSSLPVVLFDLDGTLTPPRKSIEWATVSVLRILAKSADIGIVSGSPLAYIEQQASMMWSSLGSPPVDSIILMPCNGTQLFRWSFEQRNFVQEYDRDFKKYLSEIGEVSVYKNLVRVILELQLQFIDDHPGFTELTGNFLSYRDSMINWAPVGRDAKSHERRAFAELDAQDDIRQKLGASLRSKLDELGLQSIEFALGGTTSFDIYPVGWDKTHALQHCAGRPVWFVGDKCEPGGNDHSLWYQLHASGRAYQTSGPEETRRLIEEEILPALEKAND